MSLLTAEEVKKRSIIAMKTSNRIIAKANGKDLHSSPFYPLPPQCSGVGRAAVVACCWLLRLGYFKDHREVIEWVRAQRSPKAIETKEQAQFVAGFQLWTLGGESRVASKVFEIDIQRRIDWSEANMAQARSEAAANNECGHHLALSQPRLQ